MYILGEHIGDGAFSTVRKCVDRRGNVHCCKVLQKVRNSRAKVQHEIDMLRRVSYSLRVPRLIDVVENELAFFVIQEYCKGGDVSQFQRNRLHPYRSECERNVARIVLGAARCIADMHAAGIVHRDIKHSNFVLTDSQDDAELKLCDLGLSRPCDAAYVNTESIQGTPAFMAPETIIRRVCFKSDVWSLGVMTYHLLSGTFPFGNGSIQQTWYNVLFKHPDVASEHWQRAVSPDAVDFITACLTKSDANRISLDDCLRHPWLLNNTTVFDGHALDAHPLQGSSSFPGSFTTDIP